MPDTRQHRGLAPEDVELFSNEQMKKLQKALYDFSWLLSKGYAGKSSLKIVGDKYCLRQRQRNALMRSGCSAGDLEIRQSGLLDVDKLQGQKLLLDGFNILTTIEVALSGGIILKCQDGAYRDIAGVHGTYRKVAETIPAIKFVGNYLEKIGLESCCW